MTYLMDEARSAADEARSIADDREREIDAWQRALDRYENALERARELGERDRTSRIETSIAHIEDRLEAASDERRRTRLEDAATAAWEAVREGDAVVGDDSDAAREAYDRAIDRYAEALEIARSAGDDLGARIETAIDRLESARTDCQLLAVRDRLADVLTHLDDHERARDELESIRRSLDDLDADAGPLREIARRGRARIVLDRIRDRIAAAESELEAGNYYEASETLPSTDEVRESARPVKRCTIPEPRTELEQLTAIRESHADAIDRTLANVEETPSIASVRDREPTFDVAPEDLPSGESLCEHVPVADDLWAIVAPEQSEKRAGLADLRAALEAADLDAYVSADIADRVDRRASRVAACEPITAVRRAEFGAGLRDAAIDAIEDLESRLADTVASLEAADLPPDYDARPPAVEESFADALRREDSPDAFVQRWREAFDRLTDAIDAADETAALLDTYDEVVDTIESSLADETEVTGDDLPVRRPEEIMKLYAHRRSDATYVPETSSLRPS